MSNFTLRTFSSVVMILFLIGIHRFCSAKQIFILVSSLTVGLSVEYYRLVFYKYSQVGLRRFFIVFSFLSYLSVYFFCKSASLLILLFMLINVIFILCFWIFIIFNKFQGYTDVQNIDDIILNTDITKEEKGIIKSIFISLIGLLYILSPILFLDIYYKNVLIILIYLCIVFSGDIFAYLGGALLGGKKWLPLISPGKTWSGLTSGLLISGLVCTFCFHLKGYKNLPVFFLLGVFVFFTAQTGDLFISLLKRQADVKDTGSLLPGHGGFLDRLDGFLVALPVYIGILYIVEDFSF